MSNSNSLPQPVITPIQQTERVKIVDILRGFALFGILFVNMTLFRLPFQTILLPADASASWHDQAGMWLIHFLGESKFYSLFSLLFGLGLTLLMDRIEARGGKFVPLYARRLLILLGFGLIHAFLIWIGDILVLYALLGFPLTLFRKAKSRTLLTWTIILLILPLLLTVVPTALIELGRTIPEGAAQIDQTFAAAEAGYIADVARANQVYPNGTFAEITSQRAYDYSTMGLGSFFVLGLNVLAMFLLGVWFGKQKIFQNLDENRPFFRKLLLWGLLLGIPGNAIYATMIPPLSRFEPSWTLTLATIAQSFGAPMLSLAYVSTLALLAGTPTWGKRLSVLAPVGQMALTNYLTQSIVCTLIFYGYGLGLFGKVGTIAGIGLTILIYLIQIPVSHWWMRRFQYGPAEWLWRSLTYLKPQPMRRNP